MGGSLDGHHVIHVAVTHDAAVAITRDGGLHGWGRLPSGRASERGDRTGTLLRSPQRIALPADADQAVPVAVGVAISTTHLLVMTATGEVLSAALPCAAGYPPNAAALGRPTAAEGGVDAYQFAYIVDAKRRKQRLPLRRYPLPRLASRVSATAAGSSFSLALIGAGTRRGELLYWGVQPSPGATEDDRGGRTAASLHGGRGRMGARRRKRLLPGDMPTPIERWCPNEFGTPSPRFLLIAAHGLRALVLTQAGELYSWVHGATLPRKLPPVRPPAVSAMAVGATLALLLVSTHDLRWRGARPLHTADADSDRGDATNDHDPGADASGGGLLWDPLPVVSVASSPTHNASHHVPGSHAPATPLLATPAPLPRAVLVRTDNIGVAAVAAAHAEALAASHEGVRIPSMRSPCWYAEPAPPALVEGTVHGAHGDRGAWTHAPPPGAAVGRCPLRRKADCTSWPPRDLATRVADPTGAPLVPNGSVTRSAVLRDPAASPAVRVRCLPAALVLGARGCGAPKLTRLLSWHPHVVVAPRSVERPWWAAASLSNWTDSAPLQKAAAAVLRRPRRSLLLQHAKFDAHAAGLSTSMRSAGISLGDVLPRLQPELRVLVVLCDPARRLQRVAPRTHRSLLVQQRTDYEACATHAPEAACAARLAERSPLVEGAYSVWLRELMRALPASQLRVVRAEDVRRSPTAVAAEALRFLGLRADARVVTAAAATRASAEDADAPSSRLAARRLRGPPEARAFYRDFNADLVQLMDGDERFAWPATGLGSGPRRV